MKSSSRKRKKSLLWVLWVVIGLVLIGGIVAGVRYYPLLNQKRLAQKARELLEKKDYEAATLTARRALQLNDRNAEVIRVMVQISEEVNSSALLSWKRRLADVEPNLLGNHLAVAELALKLGQAEIAEETLLPIPDLGRQSGRYHELSGKAALALKNPTKAEAEFAEALKLDPANVEYQLNLGAAQLISADAKTRAVGRADLEHLLDTKTMFDRVSRVLIDDALKRGQGARALAFANGLRQAPDTTFADRMTYLDVLYRVNRPAFPAYLTELQDEASKNPENLASLITWLNEHNSALIATSWCKTLPVEVISVMPVPFALAQSYAKINDWVGIKPIIMGWLTDGPESKAESKPEATPDTAGPWGEREFLRLAFLAAVKRSEGDLKQSKIYWNTAVKAASDRPSATSVLARYAVAWGWEGESSELLWKVAKGPADPMWALKHLYDNYQRTQSTGNLLQVATLIHQADPNNRDMANNVAFLSLLLETNVPEAIKIAEQLYKAEPQHPDYLSTYCFALYQQGQTQAALDLMKTLGPEKLKEPGVATYYAVFLAASDAPAEAAKYFEFAKDAKLLPEEKKLVARARERTPPPR